MLLIFGTWVPLIAHRLTYARTQAQTILFLYALYLHATCFLNLKTPGYFRVPMDLILTWLGALESFRASVKISASSVKGQPPLGWGSVLDV